MPQHQHQQMHLELTTPPPLPELIPVLIVAIATSTGDTLLPPQALAQAHLHLKQRFAEIAS